MPLVSLPGVCWEFAPWLVCLESGTVFRLLPWVLLPGVLAPEDEEDDEDMAPEDELGDGADCASRADAMSMLAIDVATPR